MLDFKSIPKDFEIFKSNLQHELKWLGDVDFLIRVIEENRPIVLYEHGYNREALYTLAAIDYLCRINGVPCVAEYNDLRCLRFEKPVWPRGIITISLLEKNSDAKEQALKECIPEFKRHNIIERSLRDVQ